MRGREWKVVVLFLTLLLTMPITSSPASTQTSFVERSIWAQDVLEIYSDYTFTADLIGTTIVVKADKVNIDGNGFGLYGSGSGFGIDVTDCKKVTIENLQIESWGCGIYLGASTKCTLKDNVSALTTG